MSKKNSSASRIFHFLTGCTAAAMAMNVPEKSRIRYPLFAVAGMELWKGLFAVDEEDRKIPFEKAPENSRTQTVKGIVNRWEEHGDPSPENIPVIMVHGLPTNPRVWRYIIPQLLKKKGVRVLAWEQVGFGWSMLEGLGLDLSIPRQAEYLYDWLQHLGIEKAVFVGHDYGGGVIQQLLLNHPEMAAGVVLTDSVAYSNWPVKAVRMARSLRKPVELMPPEAVKPLFMAGVSNLGHENPAIAKESKALYWAPYQRDSIGPKAFAHQLTHFNSRYTKEVGRKLRRTELNIPARVLQGGKDPLGLSSAKKLSRALQAPLIKIPGGKHFTIEDHPLEISNAVKEVIKEAKGAF